MPIALRNEGDSNPRIGFADYTLSRRDKTHYNVFNIRVLYCGCFLFA